MYYHFFVYTRAMLGVRVAKARNGEPRSLGASAIEWAIITGLLAFIAGAVFIVINRAVTNAANKAETNTNNVVK